MTDLSELKRLSLQIERDLLARASLRALVAAADATILGRRQELRAIKARISRAQGRNK